MCSRNFHKFPRNECEWNIHKIALYTRIERADFASRTLFPSVEVFPQFRYTHNAERTYAHILLNTSFRSPPLSHAHSLSLSWSLTFASLLLARLHGYVYATSNEIISLPVLVRKFRGIMLCRGRHVLHVRNRKCSKRSNRTGFVHVDENPFSRR